MAFVPQVKTVKIHRNQKNFFENVFDGGECGLRKKTHSNWSLLLEQFLSWVTENTIVFVLYYYEQSYLLDIVNALSSI